MTVTKIALRQFVNSFPQPLTAELRGSTYMYIHCQCLSLWLPAAQGFIQGGGGKGAPPLAKILLPLGACEHCVRYGNKTSVPPKPFNRKVLPLLLDNISK